MSDQTSLDDYRSEAPTNPRTVTRTIKCKLETSDRKNEQVETAIGEWQAVASRMADLMPSFPPGRWHQRDTQMTRLASDEFSGLTIYAHDRNSAVNKVREAFSSWAERGREGAPPQGRFGGSNYLRICGCCDRLEVHKNDRGYGVRLKILKRRDPLWFHVDAGDYQRDYLKQIVDGDYETGSAELHLTDAGEAFLHLTIKHDIEVYEPAGVPRYVGVDVGEQVIYAAAAIEVGENVDRESIEVQEVTMESGREFRHHRERLQRKKDRLQEQGDRRAVLELRNERERYTDHVIGTASREVVTFARNHAPCAIVLEEMGDYRETADDPIHDWPRGQLQQEITYKATDEGIPVVMVDPAGTSVTCRRCGQPDPAAREGVEFYCGRCDYEVHADVNAAINIGFRGADQ